MTALLPPESERPIPRHFYGYGVGRRLYLAAHELWPKIRWEDGAVRSTSHTLRSRLHAQDPFIWQDKSCPACGYAWRRMASPDELRGIHG